MVLQEVEVSIVSDAVCEAASSTSAQGGRTWQPIVGGKNGHENFCQARIYNFRDKCVVFARNLKFANLTTEICNIYLVIVHFLPKKHCF